MKTILIISDSFKKDSTLVNVLEQKGYNVTLKNIKEYLPNNDYTPFITICDVDLAHNETLEIIKRLKSHYTKTDILLIKNYISSKEITELIQIGIYQYFKKPVDLEQLLLAVDKSQETQKISKRLDEYQITSALYQVGITTCKIMKLKTFYSIFCQLTTRFIHACGSSFISVQNNTLNIEVFNGVSNRTAEITRDILIKHFLQHNKEPIFIEDWEVQLKHLKPDEPLCSISVPIAIENEIRGFLTAYNKISDKTFVKEDIEAISRFALNATLTIESILVYYGLYEKKQELAKAYEKLIESDKLKNNFLCNVSHELRTPLTAIKGAIELLQDKNEIETSVQKFTTIIHAHAERLLKLVDELLDFSRIESENLNLNVKKIVIAPVIEETIQTMLPLAKGKNIDINCLNLSANAEVMADESRIKQVLLNLIGNAIKFINNDNGKIFIEIKDNGNKILFSVKDNGIGIPANYQKKIFEKFYQIDGNPSRKNTGFGLGLSISRIIINAHGGEIWVQSEENKGSIFYFTLLKSP